MLLNEYQQKALRTAVYLDLGDNIGYPIKGLAGETGEFVDKLKKYERNLNIRDIRYSQLTPIQLEELAKELSDVLWYIASVAFELGYTLEDIAQKNVDKLADRHARGVTKGEGDNR